MTTEIKLLASGDAELLDKAHPDVFDDPVDSRAARTFLDDPRHHIAVAIADGAVVGFASGMHYEHPDKPSPELWINEVGVAAPYHGRGFGKALMRTLLDAGKAAGCSAAWVLTDRANAAARALYTSSGGVEDSGDTVMYEFTLDLPA